MKNAKFYTFFFVLVVSGLVPLRALSIDLYGPGGKRFDIQDSRGGELMDGTSDAYDTAYTLIVNGTEYDAGGTPGTPILSGRGIEMASQSRGDMIVKREVWVPDTGMYDYIRYYDTVENISSSSLNVTVEYRGNLGSDSYTQVTATSSGDLSVDVLDRWFCTDDGAGSDPSLAHVWYGESAAVVPSVETLSGDTFNLQFQEDIPPGGKIAFVIFAVQANDSITSQQAAQWLADFPPDAQEGLETDKIFDVVNWAVAGAPRIRFTQAEYSLEEGGEAEIAVEVQDPEGDPVTVSWDLDGDGVYDDGTGTTITLSGVGLDGPSTLAVGVKASDGTYERFRQTSVTVVNVPPVFDSDPSVDPGLTVRRGAQWKYQIQVSDQANIAAPPESPLDRLVVSVTQKPQGMIFSADLSLTWNIPRTSDVVGEHPVSIKCSDGDEGETTQEFVIKVLANTPPGKPTIISPKEETIYTLRPQLKIQNAVDEEGDQLNYMFEVASLGTFSPDSIVDKAVIPENPSGQTTWTLSKDLEDKKRYYWRVRARDNQEEGPADSTYFQIDLSLAPKDADANAGDAISDPVTEMNESAEAEACSCTLTGKPGSKNFTIVSIFTGLLILFFAYRRRRNNDK